MAGLLFLFYASGSQKWIIEHVSPLKPFLFIKLTHSISSFKNGLLFLFYASGSQKIDY